jgi:hypothetical protein
MSFFDAVGLGEIRNAVESSLPHRAALYSVTTGQGVGGAQQSNVTLLRSDVPCRLSAVNLPKSDVTTQGQNVPAGATWQVWFNVREDLDTVGRLIVTGTDDNTDAFTRAIRVIRPDVPLTDSTRRVLFGADLTTNPQGVA